MAKIKRPKFDVCDFFTNYKTIYGQLIPPPGPGTLVTIRKNGKDISVIVGSKLNDEGDLFAGKIKSFDAPKEEYDDLYVGDEILFMKENICSIS
jgi:hypothetical protein